MCNLQDELDRRHTPVFTAVAIPGLAATNFQTSFGTSGRVMGCLVWLYMRLFAQSAEDGTMPLLECMCRESLVLPAFYGPAHKGLLGWVLKDGVFGPPIAKEAEPLCVDPGGKELLWRMSEAAVGPFARNPQR
jgi:hypothetical protein